MRLLKRIEELFGFMSRTNPLNGIVYLYEQLDKRLSKKEIKEQYIDGEGVYCSKTHLLYRYGGNPYLPEMETIIEMPERNPKVPKRKTAIPPPPPPPRRVRFETNIRIKPFSKPVKRF